MSAYTVLERAGEKKLQDDIFVIERALKGQLYKTWPEAFTALCMWCEEYEISLRFVYHSGWFQRPYGEDTEPYLEEESRGYTIEVGLHAFQDEDGNEACYKKAAWAVHDGLRLLKSRLEERLESL